MAINDMVMKWFASAITSSTATDEISDHVVPGIADTHT